MNFRTETYEEQVNRLPVGGRQIIGYVENETVTVYQAFNINIASYAVNHQQFAGTHYSFNRMSWIKPGFLWMYRAGWATKPQQERILAITIPLLHFKTILHQATHSSFNPNVYANQEQWKTALNETEVRLQWDPDHTPLGAKIERKAIQLGMKGALLKQFCTEWVTSIVDITPFVSAQYQHVLSGNFAHLVLPVEQVIHLHDSALEKNLDIEKPST